MPTITIVLAFRDRDTDRIKNCLDSLAAQTFKDFTLIFVDYGSKPETAAAAKCLVSTYTFATYIYTHTEGMVWNRAHALNTALRFTNSQFILFGDVDLIYHEEFINVALNSLSANTVVSSAVFWLPPGGGNSDKLSSLTMSQCPNGAVLLLSKELLERLNGLDEYYCFWGVEDRDMNKRIELTGARIVCLDPFVVPVLHQWHLTVSDHKKNFFPARWWDTMNIYYQTNITTIKRNPTGMGKLFTEKDRPVLSARLKDFAIPTGGNSYLKAQTICSLIEAVEGLKEDEALRIELPFPSRFTLVKRKAKEIAAILRNTQVSEFVPEKDIFYLLWELIQRKIIKDYYFDFREDRLFCSVMKQ